MNLRREPAETSAGDLVRAIFGGKNAAALSAAQRAARAWYAVNGDRERAHTTGVWLRKSTAAKADPVMVVSVDSGLLAADLGANKDLYLSRLANRGVRVSDICFQVGRRMTEKGGGRSEKGGRKTERELPPLSERERAEVERAVAHLPEELRKSASRAMCASLRQNKARHT